MRLSSLLACVLLTGCVVPNPAYDPGAGGDAGAVAGQDGQAQADSLVLGQLADAQLPPDTKPTTTPKPPPTQPTSGGLCDPCDPKVGGCTITNGLCLMVEGGESFCTKPCSKSKPCPKGYDCMSVTVIKGTASPLQCVPPSLSCKK
jgi:hypothetical protein